MNMIYDPIPFAKLVHSWKLRAYCAYFRENIYN